MLIGNALLKLKTTVCASWKILKKKSFRYDLLVFLCKPKHYSGKKELNFKLAYFLRY